MNHALLSSALLVGLGLAHGAPAAARTLTVTPADDYRLIESAQPGDVVEIAPGTYRFRVAFQRGGTAELPITVRAQDPQRRPVFDLTGIPVSSAPGSYGGGDRGRGCWQFYAGHFRVSGIVWKGCVDHDSAGVRVVQAPDVTLRDCLFQGNTNGLTGSGEDLRVEFCEFDRNGDALAGDAPAHSLYIYGGTLSVRFSYFHDSPRGQHFHVRSREALLAYNWMARPGSYLGDLMTCNYLCGGRKGEAITQRLTLLGNVLIQGMPANPSQVVAVLKDEAGSADGTGDAGALEVRLIHNTILGTARQPGQSHRLVNLRNDTVGARLFAVNNVIHKIATLAEAAAPAMNNYGVTGAGNWMTTGSNAAGLADTRMGADPGLSAGFVPQAGSPVVGLAARPAGAELPTHEYYRDEMVSRLGRVRERQGDTGAFESTTTAVPFGPYDEPGPVAPGDGGSGDLPPAGPDVPAAPGCGCQVAGRAPPAVGWGWAALLGLIWAGLAAYGRRSGKSARIRSSRR